MFIPTSVSALKAFSQRFLNYQPTLPIRPIPQFKRDSSTDPRIAFPSEIEAKAADIIKQMGDKYVCNKPINKPKNMLAVNLNITAEGLIYRLQQLPKDQMLVCRIELIERD